MQNSHFETLTVQPVGTAVPTTIVKAAKVPLRVLVMNAGPVVIFIAGTTTDLTPLPSTATFRLFPGQTQVFVAAPQQGLYCVGAATGGLLSVSTSEAFPLAIS
jgi:hypothetical protein